VAIAAALANAGQIAHGIYQRREALAHLARHGIMGDNPSATWTGVNAYLRNETAPTATIAAYSIHAPSGINRYNAERGLQFDGSLRVRTGRSMPLGHFTAAYFDNHRIQFWHMRRRWVKALGEALEHRNAPAVLAHLAALGHPDYLIAPTATIAWLCEEPAFPYACERSIDEFTILRKRGRRGVTRGLEPAFARAVSEPRLPDACLPRHSQ
jgi:hypothetical protein